MESREEKTLEIYGARNKILVTSLKQVLSNIFRSLIVFVKQSQKQDRKLPIKLHCKRNLDFFLRFLRLEFDNKLYTKLML
jgi:hypothetical protein